ncbi:hypothetical protein [Pseudoxanthomonas koreensis]|uniref:hypothetical protein n=1 Tax=Pseudoxanthomonas koreensis TaxID=266061 RepID=UPI001391F324|nr:hypothetical protein [Pseudoxanthomonas koreensis]KAF1692695.1 hypothetical protein CSC64_06825 [Pseudoxanthomonas koreensis]
MTAEDCGKLWGMTADHWLRTVACRPDFPARLSVKPATWRAGEVVAYRNENRPARRGSRQNYAKQG